ncbi:cytochrome P450 4C1 [Nasonia vitripennis]|uniref:Cytochrome P450 n=1 Tax=Nasonia vitripennis TaxID=7425 RepID=A0A7M7IQB5_NASVI|nr:cytochrome P450 4C1 [Nasonia vitripennis]
MIAYVLLTCVFLLIVQILLWVTKEGRLWNKIPGPTPLPFVGNLLPLIGSTEHLWNALHDLAIKYYPIVRIWHTKTVMVLISHPDDLQVILSSKANINKPPLYDLIKPWLGDSVILSKDNKWTERRKILIPAFHLNILKKFIKVTNEHNERFITFIQSFGDESVQNVSTLLPELTLKIFCESAMGVNQNDDLIKKYKHAMEEMFGVSIYRATRPFIKDWMMPFVKIGQIQKRAVETLHGFRDQMILERRKYHESTGYQIYQPVDNESNSSNEIQYKRTLSMIDLLFTLEKEGLIDEDGINEEVDTFIVGGHDTTAIASTFFLVLLAENVYAQDRARAEITEVLANNNGDITSQLHKLHYLERCIKESIRLYPSAPCIGRILTEDIQLKNYLLPAGTEVLCMLRAAHLDPNFWPEPNKFDPDRFLPENVKDRHPFAYSPFSQGPRNCIGQKLAFLQIKILASGILSNFYLEPVDRTVDVKFRMNANLHTTKPLHVKFVKIRKD